jgi:hypothetical protein
MAQELAKLTDDALSGSFPVLLGEYSKVTS